MSPQQWLPEGVTIRAAESPVEDFAYTERTEEHRRVLSHIDRLYLERVEQEDHQFTLRQCQGMIDSIRDMYRVQVLRENPGIADRALDIAVARRIYFADPAALLMIDRIEAADAGR